MEPHRDAHSADEPLAIRDRADCGGGWSRAWPLVALALIGLMLARACVPSAAASVPTPPAATSTSR